MESSYRGEWERPRAGGYADLLDLIATGSVYNSLRVDTRYLVLLCIS